MKNFKRVDFDDYYASKVGKVFRWVDFKKIKILGEELKVFNEKDIIVDLGAGSGGISFRIKEKTGRNIICVDKNEKLLRICRDKGLSTKQADLDKKLPFDDKSVSCVIMIDVIEHIKNPQDIITEIKRILKTNGKIIVFTPAYDSIPWLIAEQVHHILARTNKSDHISPFTKESLEYLFENNFDTFRIKRVNFLLGLCAISD